MYYRLYYVLYIVEMFSKKITTFFDTFHRLNLETAADGGCSNNQPKQSNQVDANQIKPTKAKGVGFVVKFDFAATHVHSGHNQY